MTLPVLPKWATDPASLVLTPDSAKQIQGWTTDTNTNAGKGEKPPVQYSNWLALQTYLCLGAIYDVIGDASPLGTMARQDADAVDITGGNISGSAFTTGNIDSTAIGVYSPGPAIFTAAHDNGSAPTTSSQLTNKAYIDSLWYTGMTMPFMGGSIPTGWIPWNDGTIGDASSGASVRANADTANLFASLWSTSGNAQCPVSGGRGSSAAADFAAHKTLQIPRANGMTVANLGSAFASSEGGVFTSARVYAEITGEEAHTLTIPEIPAHNHDISNGRGGTFDNTNLYQGTPNFNSTHQTGSTGGDGAHNTIQPTVWLTFIIKL